MLRITEEAHGVWCVCGQCGHCRRRTMVKVTRSGAAWIVYGWRWMLHQCGHEDCASQLGMLLDEVARMGGRRALERVTDYAVRRGKIESQDKRQGRMVFKYAA